MRLVIIISVMYTTYKYSLCTRVGPATASYFGVPRIHFSGRIQADVSTGNNFRSNYLIAKYNGDDIYPYWNLLGSGEFWFTDCTVTAVVYKNGTIATTAEQDPLIGKPIVNNPAMVPAKLVDLDSPDYDFSSTLYGMRFGVDWSPTKQSDSFIGEWVPSILTRDYWARQINDTSADRFTQTLATQGASRLVNVEWGTELMSEGLTELKKEYDERGSEALSVSVSLFNYTRPYQDEFFLYGLVLGSVGIGSLEEPLSFVGERVMQFKADPPENLTDNNSCAGASGWLSTSYFTVHTIAGGTSVTIDFGNSAKLDFGGKVCDFGQLHLGILRQTMSGKHVDIVGEIPYRNEMTSGVFDFTLSKLTQQISNHSQFVVVKQNNKPSDEEVTYPVCQENAQVTTLTTCVYIILEETPIQVRPMDNNVVRLEAGQSVDIRMFVHKFGTPLAGKVVKLIDTSPNGASSTSGMVYSNTARTNNKGIATFNFTAKDVGKPRGKTEMDGIVYAFSYCIDTNGTLEDCEYGYTNELGFLVWGKTTYNEPVFWDDHVQPIFHQYEVLYPVMKNILRLGEYDDVTKPQNIRLLKKAMSLDVNHPSYMPVTRDLSPSRREMILKWLNSTELYRNWSHVEETRYTPPEFCKHNVVLEDDLTDMIKSYQRDFAGEKIYEESLIGDEMNTRRFQLLSAPISGADEPMWLKEAMDNNCSVESLMRDLQDAVTLEFATIPLYLTSMYSIKLGHNPEVYKVIRSVVMQEMLHMAQVANILISLGGRPIIDDKRYVPSYPGKLPASILPGLEVTLQKASPKHIHDVFMMVEFPHDEKKEHPEFDSNQLTIGHFYRQIRQCMNRLDEPIFCKDMNETECLSRQMHWPWENYDPTSKLYKVTNLPTAKKALKMIVQQGEGAGKQNPTYLHTDYLAHFYKFEELACKRHMIVKDEHEYSFGGSEIEFAGEGVWPMRDNPSKADIPKNTQLYHKARRFHRIYRAFLAKLQNVFDGNPAAIDDAVYMMESLQLHTKELMQSEIPSPPGWPKQTCGPIFDYDWE